MWFLAADKKQQRVNVCEELRQFASDGATILSMVIVGEESWLYGCDTETKKQFLQWKIKVKLRACS
jgi:hypothetical protein